MTLPMSGIGAKTERRLTRSCPIFPLSADAKLLSWRVSPTRMAELHAHGDHGLSRYSAASRKPATRAGESR
jgi:hypothetical protein